MDSAQLSRAVWGRSGQRQRPPCTQSLVSDARTSWLPGEESEWSSLSQVSSKVRTPVEDQQHSKQEPPLGLAEHRERGLMLRMDTSTRKGILRSCMTFLPEVQAFIHFRESKRSMACINISINSGMCNEDVRCPKTLS